MAVIRFNDRCCSIKPIGTIVKARKSSGLTLQIVETTMREGITETDVLEYQDAETLRCDIKRLHEELDSYYKRAYGLDQAQNRPIGFGADAISDQELIMEEDYEDGWEDIDEEVDQ